MTQFIGSPMLHRQFGSPFDGNNGELKASKRGRSSMAMDDCEESFDEDEVGYGDIDQSNHIDFNPEKRIRNQSFPCGGIIEDTHNEYVNPEKRCRTSATISQPKFSSHAGFSFNDSSTTILKLEGELRNERHVIQVKEEQLHMASLENKSISDQIQVFEVRHVKLTEENQILKRAVNIQEGRMKECNQHNVQLQHILAQAAQRIAQLEHSLGVKKSQGGGEPSFGVRRPPDVC